MEPRFIAIPEPSLLLSEWGTVHWTAEVGSGFLQEGEAPRVDVASGLTLDLGTYEWSYEEGLLHIGLDTRRLPEASIIAFAAYASGGRVYGLVQQVGIGGPDEFEETYLALLGEASRGGITITSGCTPVTRVQRPADTGTVGKEVKFIGTVTNGPEGGVASTSVNQSIAFFDLQIGSIQRPVPHTKTPVHGNTFQILVTPREKGELTVCAWGDDGVKKCDTMTIK